MSFNKASLSILTILALIAGFAAAMPVLAAAPAAASSGAPNGQFRGMHRGQAPGARPGVMGAVTAISGATLTVAGRQGFGAAANGVTYAVDASKATVLKDNVTSTLSAIAVNDVISVRGAVSGTNVAATEIRDGPGGNFKPGQFDKKSSTTPPIQGNGQPVIAGTISAISGSALTVKTASGIQYTVDATSAKIVKGQGAATISDVSVGDSVVVQGATNGTSVTASSVIDQTRPVGSGDQGAAPGAANNAPQTKPLGNFGFLGQIGGFFKHLFGF